MLPSVGTRYTGELDMAFLHACNGIFETISRCVYMSKLYCVGVFLCMYNI